MRAQPPLVSVPETGGGYGMTGAARAFAVLAVLLSLAGCADDPVPAEPAPDPTSSSLDPFEIGVGDCVDSTTGAGEVTQVPVVSCSEPHVGEAYESVTMTGDGEFPGDEAVVEAARGCEEPFEDFVGVALAVSQLKVTYFHPTAESWATGDREILCIVSDPLRPIQGSLRNANR